LIVGFEDLEGYRKRVAMVDGAFDPLHAGHIDYFREARALGLPLLCNVASDAYVGTKHAALVPAAQRVVVLDAIRYIDYTHLNTHDTETVLRRLQPVYYVKGRDWEGRLPAEQLAICERLGIRIVYLDTVRDSSTRLLAAWAAFPPATRQV
jgi:D-beta-D-heptose 7-phosphate kinase/D-beta-D-heptose 1-phosphate adenosyltransferase